MEKSRGHVAFDGDFEIYVVSGQVYRAPIGNAIDAQTGCRIGRWESSVEMWNRFRSPKVPHDLVLVGE